MRQSNGMHRVYLTGKGSSLAFVMNNYTDCFIVNECIKLNGIKVSCEIVEARLLLESE